MKQSIISIGMTACCLSGNGQFLFAADKPAQEERPNILFILSDDHTSQSWGIYGGCWVIMRRTRISVAWPRRAAC